MRKKKIRYNTTDPFSVSIEPDEQNEMKDIIDDAIKAISDKKEEVLGKALDHYGIPKTRESIKSNVTIQVDKDKKEHYFMNGKLAVSISPIIAYEGDKAFINIERHYLKTEENNNEQNG